MDNRTDQTRALTHTSYGSVIFRCSNIPWCRCGSCEVVVSLEERPEWILRVREYHGAVSTEE